MIEERKIPNKKIAAKSIVEHKKRRNHYQNIKKTSARKNKRRWAEYMAEQGQVASETQTAVSVSQISRWCKN